jgi:hypothetical protein
MNKPVLINPNVLSPHKTDGKSMCDTCNRQVARWTVSSEEQACSMCILYRTEWGEENKDGIEQLARACLGSAPVVLDQDADRVLMSIYWTSMVKAKYVPK